MASACPTDMHSKIMRLKDKVDTLVATTTVIAEDLDDILLDSFKSINSYSFNNKRGPPCGGNIIPSFI